jgi:predicted kinase
MISLIQLLEEVSSRPKAIILAGSPGAGKTSFVENFIQPFKLEVLNIDDYYKQNLQQAGVSLNLKQATAEERSKSSSAMHKSIKEYQAALNEKVKQKANILIDSTSGSFKKTAELKNYLVQNGYDVFMVYMFASLKKSLRRNDTRFDRSNGKDRSLPPSIVLQTWVNVSKNYDNYRTFFGDNFISIVNDDLPKTLSSLKDIKQIYLEPYKITDSKPKTPQEQAKSDSLDKENDLFITNFWKSDKTQDIIDNSISKKEAQAKIKSFLQS